MAGESVFYSPGDGWCALCSSVVHCYFIKQYLIIFLSVFIRFFIRVNLTYDIVVLSQIALKNNQDMMNSFNHILNIYSRWDFRVLFSPVMGGVLCVHLWFLYLGWVEGILLLFHADLGSGIKSEILSKVYQRRWIVLAHLHQADSPVHETILSSF